MRRETRAISKKSLQIQIRIIAEDPQLIANLLNRIANDLELKNVKITGIYPNRKEPGYRGYLVAEVEIYG